MASNNSSAAATAAANTTSSSAATGAEKQKKGKFKGKTVDLQEFLTNPINWAEEMEAITPADPDHGTGFGGDYTTTIEVRTEIIQKRSQLPTAPKAALNTTFDPSRVPTTPPFSAYIGNVSYDAQEEDIERFFKGLRVNKVRLMREGSRAKGFGYVEFDSREDLIEALAMDKQRFLNREIKIDLAGRQEDRSQSQRQSGGYISARGGRQQRMGGGYDGDKGRDREQETSGDWRMASRPSVGPPSPYDDGRRSQPRAGGPPQRQMQQSQPGYGYPPAAAAAPPPHGYGPYAPHPGYPRRPDDYPPQQYQRGPSGYDSDYGGNRGGGGGGGYGGGYDSYPMMRQASYSSQHSGYASDREGGSHYRRGFQSAGFYNSMRRDYKGDNKFSGDRRPSGQHTGGDRYQAGEGYNGPPYADYNQPHYQDGYGGGRDGYGRQQRQRGGYTRGPPPPHDEYAYDESQYGGGRRTEERISSVETTDSNDAAANRPKERPKLALKPRTLPLPTESVSSTDGSVAPSQARAEGSVAPKQEVAATEQAQGEQPGGRSRAAVPAAEVFGGARPVDTSAREREVEEKIKREKEEFRRLEEERRQQQQQYHQGEHLRKSSSSHFGPERMSVGSRRRTSDSQCSSGGGSQIKGSIDNSGRKDYDDQSAGGQMKILQRSRTAPSDMTGDAVAEQADYENQLQEQPYGWQHQQRQKKKSVQRSSTNPSDDAAAEQLDDEYQQHQPSGRSTHAQSQNYWTQSRRRGDERSKHGENSAARSDVQTTKAVESRTEDVGNEGGEHVPAHVADKDRGGVGQSKSSETDPEQRHPEQEHDDAVFKPQHQRYPHYSGQRGHRGGRGGRGGAPYHPHHQSHYQQDATSTLPPRFARERDQQQFQRRGSSQTDDGQEEQSERRRLSKEIVIRRGGQGTLSPAAGNNRRGGPAGAGGRPQHRPGSREREYGQKRNDRRQQQRRGSADFSVSTAAKQHDDAQAAQKPPAYPRRQQPASNSGSRKSSAGLAVLADPPPVSFESRNKFEMLDMEDD